MQHYKLYDERDLSFLKQKNNHGKRLVLDFNINKLELEYDYDTDEGQMKQAKEMLAQENAQAIDFTIKENPIDLVENLSLVFY